MRSSYIIALGFLVLMGFASAQTPAARSAGATDSLFHLVQRAEFDRFGKADVDRLGAWYDEKLESERTALASEAAALHVDTARLMYAAHCYDKSGICPEGSTDGFLALAGVRHVTRPLADYDPLKLRTARIMRMEMTRPRQWFLIRGIGGDLLGLMGSREGVDASHLEFVTFATMAEILGCTERDLRHRVVATHCDDFCMRESRPAPYDRDASLRWTLFVSLRALASSPEMEGSPFELMPSTMPTSLDAR
jgi:hypothetical protein